jgi:hypothetical protein
MNKKIGIIFILQINVMLSIAQVTLTIEDTTVNNNISGTWDGINIRRSVTTRFAFRNNSVSSVNNFGYMLQAGDETVGPTNNKLDGEEITGNKFTWNGTDSTSITHGIFTGHNRNAVIKYNYLNKVPMAVVRKSANNMTNSSGGIAYNIIYEPNVGIVIKGMSDVLIFNNTFYRNDDIIGRGFIDIYTNTDNSPASYSHGTKIMNNIFYTKKQTANIRVLDNESFKGFVCDYNLYWCESGSPGFEVNGKLITYAEWQNLGYDTHSVIINPGFTNYTDFIPSSPLSYGTPLGADWTSGLSSSSGWTTGISPDTTNQTAVWQVGARILNSGSTPEPPAVSITSPANQSTFSVPADITITADAFDSDGTISLVEFYSDGTKIGESRTAPYTIVWHNQRIGTFSVSATATDNSNLKTTSLPVTVIVGVTKPSVTIYPNPTSGRFTLNLESASDSNQYEISIFTINGKKILSERLLENDISMHFDISRLENGVYLLLIEGQDIRLIKKIIKF